MTDDRLAAWFRQVEMSPGSDRLVALATAIPEAASNLKLHTSLGMVRLAYGHADDSAFDVLQSAVKEHDASFASRVDDLETKVAAAGVVAATIDEGGQLGAAAALSVQCQEFVGATASTLELSQIADSHLRSRSQSSRASRSTVPAPDPRTIKKFAAPEGEAPTAEMVAEHFDSQVAAVLKWTKEQIGKVAQSARHNVSIATEETDIVWWAFSGHSELTGTLWIDAPSPDALPVAMGHELASLVRFDVPPASATAILSRVAGSSAKSVVSIAAAVEAARPVVPASPEIPNMEIFPITLSLRECHDFDGAEAWRASVLRWGVTTDEQRPVVDIAAQTVRELLLLRMLSDE